MAKPAAKGLNPVGAMTAITVPKAADPAPAPAPKPDRKAFTIERVPGGWSLVTLTYNDSGLVGVEASQPDLKAMIIEQFKIASWKYWSKIG